MLPATNDLLTLATGGDFAATIGCTGDIETCRLVRLDAAHLDELERAW